jgi:hypothetical protein
MFLAITALIVFILPGNIVPAEADRPRQKRDSVAAGGSVGRCVRRRWYTNRSGPESYGRLGNAVSRSLEDDLI